MTITERQRENRRWFIGSSDAAAACGVSRWCTRLELWLDKTGRRQRTPMDEERAALGNLMEPVVGAFFNLRHRQYGRRAVPQTVTLYDDYRAANLDFLVEPEDRPLEAKTAAPWMEHEFTDQPPIDYRLQVEHQLAVSGYGDEAWLSVLIGGIKARDFEITSDPTVRREMLRLEADFHQRVIEERMPEPVNAADVLLLHATDNREYITATPELRAVHLELAAIAKHVKEYRDRREQLADQVALALGIRAGFTDEHGNKLISWTAPAARHIDWQSVCAELYPVVSKSMYEQAVRKHSTPPSRRLHVH